MRHLDLFSGIGGFALAASSVWDDYQNVAFCEMDEFCQGVLEKHWPDAPIYGEIKELTKQRYIQDFGDPGNIDLLTGGFPCQPFSSAGKRRGTKDDRHLWPEMLRVIREFHPRWIIGENVGGFVTWNGGMVLEQVHADLEGEGYSVQAFIIPAVAVGAPHRRDRIWIIANTGHGSGGAQQEQQQEERPQEHGRSNDARRVPHWSNHWAETATRLCRVDDGLPRRLDRTQRLKALGNAIVPQVAAEIMTAIKTTDHQRQLGR